MEVSGCQGINGLFLEVFLEKAKTEFAKVPAFPATGKVGLNA
jgi:hypothetical protein